MVKVTYGGLEGDAFAVNDIPEVHAIIEVTGKSLDDALVEQALVTRQACASAMCGAFATKETYMGNVDIDTGMGGWIDGERVFVDIQAGCHLQGCPSRDLAGDLSDRVLGLAERCQAAIDAANNETTEILDQARVDVAEIMGPAEAEAAAILGPAKERAQAVTILAEVVSDKKRLDVYREALGFVDKNELEHPLELDSDFKDILERGYFIHLWNTGGSVRVAEILEPGKKMGDPRVDKLGYGAEGTASEALLKARNSYLQRVAKGKEYLTEEDIKATDSGLATGAQCDGSYLDAIAAGNEVSIFLEDGVVVVKIPTISGNASGDRYAYGSADTISAALSDLRQKMNGRTF